MSTLPLVESILLEIRQSLGCPSYQSTTKKKFATGQASIVTHKSRGVEILQDIFKTLDMLPKDREESPKKLDNVMDIVDFTTEFANAYKSLELKTWTFAADERQVLWALLGYLYIPGLARYMGIRSFDQMLDRGMPSGRFWYLPEPHIEDSDPTVYLPVVQVIDWILDLLGMSVEKFADKHSMSTDRYHDGLRRSMYNWRNGAAIQPSKIKEYFPDSVTLEFRGAFSLDAGLTPAGQFRDALEFVTRKKLTADTLRMEIPMTEAGLLEEILAGRADDGEQAAFVKYLVDRYSTPSMHTIRQRLVLARAVQDGYVRLLKFLCPGVDQKCADAQKNKLLQLFSIYKIIYNLTFTAASTSWGQGEEAENACFDALLPEWDKCGLFLSIAPSLKEVAMPELARLLTRQFYDMKAGAELENHVGLDVQTAEPIIRRDVERAVAFHDELDSEQKLVARMNNSLHWRVLQSERRFWVISQLASNPALRPRAKKVTIERMRELAETSAETVQAILIELDGYLNGERKLRQKDARAKVQSLLDEAEASEAYELWKAPLLQYKAKHLLASNDFEAAVKLFRAASSAGRERNFGTLNGEIARDCFAVEVANQKLIHNNHEKYYREMLAGGMMGGFGEIPPTLEETARWVSNYFWDDLYKPYSGFPTEKRRAIESIEQPFKELLSLILENDLNSLQHWIKTNRKLLKTNLPDVDGNSVLMLLVKMLNGFRQQLPLMIPSIPLEQLQAINQFECLLNRCRKILEQLASESPEQLNIPDMKGQTPLMLMAEAGDTEFVKVMLLAGANPDLQDWQGMTALHAAIKSRVDSCVDALLDRRCSLKLCTQDGRSPLHTAAWTGNLHAAERLLFLAPELAWRRHADGRTPLEDVEILIEHPVELGALDSELAKTCIRCASKQELESVANLLEQAPLAQKT